MAIKQKIKGMIGEVSDRYYIMRAKSIEIEKYRDSRREKIMAQKPLSNQEKAEIDAFYLENYGEKIPYVWHQYYSAVTGCFDVKYFPELLFVPEFERYMNPYSHYAETFSDKNILPYIAGAANVEVPKTVVSCVFGQYRDCDNQLITAKEAHSILKNRKNLFAKFQERKYGKLEQVNFRAKDECWKKFGMKENQRYIPKGKDPFMNMFLDNFCLRPSCYTCCAKKHKLSDISIADFWGIERVAPEMNDGMGTSLIIVRTEKGQELFDKIKGAVHWQEVDYNDAIRENPAEYCSVERPSQRDSFFFDLQSQSFNYMIRKYAPDIKGIRVKILWRRVKSLMKKKLKKLSGGGKIENSLNYGILFTFLHEDR